MSEPDRSPFRLDADLISLRALVAIADEGSFSAAARRIGRTQSAVSLQIAKLEERLQTRLLERTSRQVSQTAAGELLIAYARRILAIADEAAVALSAPASSAPLRIGFAEHLAPEHLHDLLGRFRRAHPKLAFELKLGTGLELGAALAEDRLDIVIAGPDAGQGGTVGGTVLLEEPMVWAAAAADDLLEQDGPLSLVVMPPPCSYRQIATDALTRGGRSWRITMEANSIQGIQSAVKARLGISVMARSAVTEGLRIVDVGVPQLPDTAMIAYEAKTAHPLAGRFLSFLEEGLTQGGVGG
ncbi:MAG: LysR family transcriptional regulator [Pseudomonadota bacterium]